MIKVVSRAISIGVVAFLLIGCQIEVNSVDNNDSNGTDNPDNGQGGEQNSSVEKIIISRDGSGNYTCDGIDDDEQINKALKELSSSGGIVHLKAGTYTISKQIQIEYNGTTLEGEGADKTVIKLKENANLGEYNATYDMYIGAPPLIKNMSSAMQNLTFKNFTLDGNKFNQHYTINGNRRLVEDGHDNYHGFIITGLNRTNRTKHITFNNMKILNTCDDGILTENVKDIKVDNVIFKHIGHSGTYMIYSDNIEVKNSEFLVTVNSGVRFDSSNNIVVQNNRIYGEIEKTGNSNFGIQFTVRDKEDMPFDNVLLEKNVISHTAGAGIAIDAEDPSNTNNLLIKNNVIYQCGNVGTTSNRRETGGINIKNLNGTTIINNTLVNNIGGGIRIGGITGFYPEVPVNKTLERTTIIKNNIITHTIEGKNAVSRGYGIDIQDIDVNKVTCSYNILWNNDSGNQVGCEVINNSINENPIFISIAYGDDFWTTNDSNFNLHLKANSPAIDAGDPNENIKDEPRPNGGIINIGAYGGTSEATSKN